MNNAKPRTTRKSLLADIELLQSRISSMQRIIEKQESVCQFLLEQIRLHECQPREEV